MQKKFFFLEARQLRKNNLLLKLLKNSPKKVATKLEGGGGVGKAFFADFE